MPPVDLGQGARRALFTSTAAEQLFQAKVYPNQAESYVSFTFTGSMGKDIHSLDSSDIPTMESYAYAEDQIGGIAYAILKHDFGYPILEDSIDVNTTGKLRRLSNNLLQDNIKIYPNPGKDQITIELYALAGNSVTLTVYDVQGRLIETFKVREYQKLFILKTSSYESGQYFLKCTDNTGKQLQEKFSILR